MKKRKSPNKDKSLVQLREYLKKKYLKSLNYSISDLAKIINRSKQSLYLAVNQGKLKAHKDPHHTCWLINTEDLRDYIRSMYNRDLVKNEKGKLIYDSNKNTYSIKTISKKYNISVQRIYYAIRKNWISYKKHKSRYIIKVPDEEKFLEKVTGARYKKTKIRRLAS